MATRSNIGILNNDGSVRMIYCHWDGYPSHHMPILSENYNTLEKAEELLSLGDLSSLGTNIAHCEAYHRDKGEDLNPPRTYSNKEEAMNHMEEYLYLFDSNTNTWNMCYE